MVTTESAEVGDIVVSQKRKRAKRRRAEVLLGQFGVVALFLLGWQFLTGSPKGDGFYLVDKYFTSQPTDIVAALSSWASDGVLGNSILQTAKVTVIGLALGVLCGMAVGFVLGVKPMIAAMLNPILSALYSIPRLALIPLFLLWFGLGIGTKLAMIVVIVFFLVFYNTFSGVRDVERELVDVLRLMGASKWQIYGKVVIQSATVWIIAGLRIAAPYALVAAVTAEMLTSNSGMGFLVMRSAGQFYTAGVFAAIIVMMAMAMVLTGIVAGLERRLLHWKPNVESDRGL